LKNHKEEMILFLQQNYIDKLLISETHFTTTKITLAYHDTNYTTPTTLMAQRMEALQYL
jgi:hypothetical protein